MCRARNAAAKSTRSYKEFQCVKCDFSLRKTLGGRMFEIEEVEKLISEKQIGPLQGFRSKQGFPFAAVLKLHARVQSRV